MGAIGREASPEGDLVNFLYADALEGCLLAHDGCHEEAEALLRAARDQVEATDFFFARSEIRRLHAETLCLAGDATAAAREAADGVRILDAKGDLMSAARARASLDELGIAYT